VHGRVVAVGAGKGGVGKSTVALNLARALRAYGAVGLLDLDFYGPNIPAMVGIEHEQWTRNWTLASQSARRFKPVLREDLAIVSSGFILGEDQPLGVDAMTAGLIAKQLIHGVAWPELHYLIVDLPPGTSVVQQILVRELECAGALVVVTPQLVAHLDARKAVQMFRSLNVLVLGGVENMSDTTCPHCGETLSLFAPAPHERSIWAMGVEKLAQIPLLFGASSSHSVTGSPTGSSSAYAELAERMITRLPPAERPSP
jgi:ATP-binding protein involved in chromosome partitioning